MLLHKNIVIQSKYHTYNLQSQISFTLNDKLREKFKFCSLHLMKINVKVHFILLLYYDEERLWMISFGDKENNPNSHVLPIATNSKLGIQTLKR